MLDKTVRRNVVEAYREIHKTELFGYTKTGFDQIDEHLAFTNFTKGRWPADLDMMLWQMGRAKEAILASGIDLVPCFNDANVTNYMVDDQKDVRLIDWEYASVNDPDWDIAIYFVECLFDRATQQEVIEQYLGEYRQDMHARIYLYYWLCCVKWGLWAAFQGSISELPFDFCKYSDFLFMRARKAMRDSRWEDALSTL